MAWAAKTDGATERQGRADTWAALEEAHATGKCKFIGQSWNDGEWKEEWRKNSWYRNGNSRKLGKSWTDPPEPNASRKAQDKEKDQDKEKEKSGKKKKKGGTAKASEEAAEPMDVDAEPKIKAQKAIRLLTVMARSFTALKLKISVICL